MVERFNVYLHDDDGVKCEVVPSSNYDALAARLAEAEEAAAKWWGVMGEQRERLAAAEAALQDIATTFHGNPTKYTEAANHAAEVADAYFMAYEPADSADVAHSKAIDSLLDDCATVFGGPP